MTTDARFQTQTPARTMSRPQIDALHQVIVIARLTFREAQRRRLLWLGLGLGLAFVLLFSVGFYFAYQECLANECEASVPGAVDFFLNMFLMAGLYVVNFLAVMVTVLTSVGTLSAEIDSNTIHSIAAKPIRRWQIVVGKYIGHALMLMLYVLLMSSGIIIAVRLLSGFTPPNVFGGIAILLLEALVTLSITFLGGSRLSTLANGVVVFMLYGVAFVGGWIETIGTVLDSRTAMDIGVASSLIMPSEALWRYAASLMQSSSGLMVSVTPFTAISQPTPAFVIYALVYTLAGLLGSVLIFNRRDF
jgi:Cu-processing system permease protein